MNRRCLTVAVYVVFAIAGSGCGLTPDVPIPSPHAIAVVSPAEAGGATYLFAANRYLDKVYRVNLDTLDIAEIKVGNKPRNIAASPDGKLIAVANEAGESITVIRAATLVKMTIKTGRRPTDVRFSPDGNWIGVANLDNESVSLIDAHNGKLWEVWVGGGPAALAFDPTSNYAAVACYNEDALKIISVQDKRVLYEWYDEENLIRPQAVIFGRDDGRTGVPLFVGCHEDPYEENHESYADSIVVFHLAEDWFENPDGDVPPMDVVRSGPNPRGFLWNHAGDALLAINHVFEDWDGSYNADTVSLLRVSGDQVEEERRFVTEENPVAAALAPVEDQVAVANKNGNSVTIINLEDNSTRNIHTAQRPFALAFTTSGNKVIVVHESPLMPLSVVDIRSGAASIVYDSLSMNDWIE